MRLRKYPDDSTAGAARHRCVLPLNVRSCPRCAPSGPAQSAPAGRGTRAIRQCMVARAARAEPQARWQAWKLRPPCVLAAWTVGPVLPVTHASHVVPLQRPRAPISPAVPAGAPVEVSIGSWPS
jgi:hypothetical protein